MRGMFEFIGGTGSTKGYSVRYDACRGRYRVALQRHYWNNYNETAGWFSGATNLYEQRRHLVYHELGHALLRYNHSCNGTDIQIGNRPTRYVVHDIMFATRSCVDIGVGYSYTTPLDWVDQLDRFFDTELHTTYTCGSRKSTTPILDY